MDTFIWILKYGCAVAVFHKWTIAFSAEEVLCRPVIVGGEYLRELVQRSYHGTVYACWPAAW